MLHVFPSNGVGVHHAIMSLLAFIWRHNLKVGTRNRTGSAYMGHFNLHLMNTIHQLLHVTQHLIPGQDLRHGWINGTLYEPTAEKVGIVAIPRKLAEEANMRSFQVDHTRKMNHAFLAQNQGTLHAVMPVHTEKEKILFGHLKHSLRAMQEDHFTEVAKIWNECYADGVDYFYKVQLHLVRLCVYADIHLV